MKLLGNAPALSKLLFYCLFFFSSRLRKWTTQVESKRGGGSGETSHQIYNIWNTSWQKANYGMFDCGKLCAEKSFLAAC
jgi:hypothetical protein